jgi:hypothetical protein
MNIVLKKQDFCTVCWLDFYRINTEYRGLLAELASLQPINPDRLPRNVPI